MNIVMIVADIILSFFDNPSNDVKGYAVLAGCLVLLYGVIATAVSLCLIGRGVKRVINTKTLI